MSFRVDSHVKEVLNLSDDALSRTLVEWAFLAEGFAKLEITKKKAIDTGNLRNSITGIPIVNKKCTIVGTNVEYGPYVELGTYKMTARPFIRPAVEDHIKDYRAVLEEEMRNG